MRDKETLKEYLLIKHQVLERTSTQKTLILGFLVGVLMILIPLIIGLLALFLPFIYHFLIELFTHGDTGGELIILTSFTKHWRRFFFIVFILMGTFGFLGFLMSYLRKLGYQRDKKGRFSNKLYVSGTIQWVFVTLSLLFFMRKVDFNPFGVLFLAIVGGWFFRFPIQAYFLYLEDLIYEHFIIKDWHLDSKVPKL